MSAMSHHYHHHAKTFVIKGLHKRLVSKFRSLAGRKVGHQIAMVRLHTTLQAVGILLTFDHFIVHVYHALIVVNADNVGDVGDQSLMIHSQHDSDNEIDDRNLHG